MLRNWTSFTSRALVSQRAKQRPLTKREPVTRGARWLPLNTEFSRTRMPTVQATKLGLKSSRFAHIAHRDQQRADGGVCGILTIRKRSVAYFAGARSSIKSPHNGSPP